MIGKKVSYSSILSLLKGVLFGIQVVLKDEGKVLFTQSFRTNNKLPKKQNYEPFKEYFVENEYVVSFPTKNSNGNTILVVPTPIKGKNYATLRDFVDNAPETQQKEFWKRVSKEARIFMKKKGKVWISVHGLGVHYTHVRISSVPKNYFNNKLKQE